MTLKLDSLVRGAPGVHRDRTVRGRVYRILHSGAAAVWGEDGKQWVVNEPEVIGDPRPVISRGDIPARLRS
jgi:hypothetical protein